MGYDAITNRINQIKTTDNPTAGLISMGFKGATSGLSDDDKAKQDALKKREDALRQPS